MSHITYSFRPSLMSATWEFRLTPDALEWEAGRRSGRVRYDQVRRMRLSFRPLSLQFHRFIAEVWPVRGPKLLIASTSWRSLVEYDRQDAAYSAFVREVGQRIAAAGTRTSFDAGYAPVLWWLGVAVFTMTTLGLAFLLVRTLQTSGFGAAAFIACFFALFLWQVGAIFRRNRPGGFTPDQPPALLLPGALSLAHASRDEQGPR